jgi:large subunit ribosomal protein L13
VNTLSYKTKFANENNFTRNWFVVDAEGEILGRLASKVANVIRGKYKADFTPHFNSGDKVIVLNAEKIRLTGNKMNQKVYIRHTGYPGGVRKTLAKDMLAKKPEEMIRMAVKGMLPKNRLQKVYLKNLHVYKGIDHPHQAQKPVELEIN